MQRVEEPLLRKLRQHLTSSKTTIETGLPLWQVATPRRTRRTKLQLPRIGGKKESRLKVPMLLMKVRRVRRTKARLRDRRPKLRIKGKQPTQRMPAKLREHASRTKLRLFRGRTQRKGSSLRTRRLSHSTSIFQNSRIR